jgi:catechol 2,3-dioxygenase-like lactoylglutathione lyase family enzyme
MTPNMPRLSLVAFLVPDYDPAIHWFVNVLGFVLIEDQDLGGGKRWVRVAATASSETHLLLARAGDEGQSATVGRQAGGRVGWFLEVEDFTGTHARMLAAGVAFRESPRREPYGWVAVFEDPWGGKWDLLQRN